MLGSGLSHSQQCCPKPEHDDDHEGDGDGDDEGDDDGDHEGDGDGGHEGDGDGDHDGDGDPPVLPAAWLLLGREVSRP